MILDKNRIVLINWICDVSKYYQLNNRTLYLAVIIIDRYLNIIMPPIKQLQAVGIVSIIISNKLNGNHDLNYDEAIYTSKYQYNKQELLVLEKDILNNIQFKVHEETLVDQINIILCNIQFKKNDIRNIKEILILLLFSPFYNSSIAIIAKQILNEGLQCINSSYKMINSSEPIISYIAKYYHYRTKTECIDIEIIKKINTEINYSNNISLDEINKINIYTQNQISNLIKIKQLGKGTFGRVYSVKMGEKFLAIKEVKKKNLSEGIYNIMLREINFLNLFNHPNIIKMDGCYYDFQSGIIGMEIMESSLHDHIIYNWEYISQYTKQKYIIQLLTGLEYLHNHKIMHRDLFTKNILISGDTLKIADFGGAQYFCSDQYKCPRSSSICTIYTRSIENIYYNMSNIEEFIYDFTIDIWACACIIAFILQGDYLFQEDTDKLMLNEIYKKLGVPDYNYDTIQYPSNIYHQYPYRGLTKLEKKFPGETEVLYKMLNYNPDERINASCALALFSELYNF